MEEMNIHQDSKVPMPMAASSSEIMEEGGGAVPTATVKRGPFLPRSDLANKSPEDDDNDDCYGYDDDDILDFERNGGGDGGLKLSSSSSVSLSKQSKQGGNNNKKKKLPNLPPAKKSKAVSKRPIKKSSSSLSNSYNLKNNSIKRSSSTPILERRKSSSPFPSKPVLRHGDGSLAGTLSLGGGGGLKRGGMMRSRSPSPAAAAGRRGTIDPPVARRQSVGTNSNISSVGGIGNVGQKKLNRSRTPSPAPRKRMEHASPSAAAAARQTQLGSTMKSLPSSHYQKLQQKQSSSTDHQQYSNNSATTNLPINNNAPLPSSPTPSQRDYTQSLDCDPTPVREARRLTMQFQNRSTLSSSPSVTLMMTNIGESGSSPPLSYSKVLQKGLLENATNTTGAGAGAGGGSSPMSAMKLFQSSSTAAAVSNESNASTMNSDSNSSNGNVNELSTLLEGFSDLNESQTSLLSSKLFSRTSGIDSTNLHRLLSKSSKQRNGNGSEIKQWDLKKRLEHKEEECGMLRVALGDLLNGKDDFVVGAVEIEKGLRSRFVEVKQVFDKMASDKCTVEKELEREKEENASLKQQLLEMQRERDSYSTKCDVLQNELDGAKKEVQNYQTSHTENAVSLALVQSKLEECIKSKNEALEEVKSVRVALEEEKVEAVKEAEERVANEFGVQLSGLKEEKEGLTKRLAVKEKNEEDICTLFGLDVAASVDVAMSNEAIDNTDNARISTTSNNNDADTASSFLVKVVKAKVEEFQKVKEEKNELEKNLECCMDELEKAEADYKAALETVTTKEGEISELKKSIDNIQLSSDGRQLEADSQRKAAEDRAAAAEGQLAECKEKLLQLGQEKTSLEEALELLKAECATHKSTIDNLQTEMVDLEESKIEAVNEAEARVATEMGEQLTEVQEKNDQLKSELEVRQSREEEICTMLGVDCASVDFISDNGVVADGSGTAVDTMVDASNGTLAKPLFLETVKERLDAFKRDRQVKEELERNLESCFDELEKAEADHRAALETVAKKERDMTALMKSIGDIQRSGQDREQEVANQRKAAEDRAIEAEKQIVECREKLLSLGHEKKSLEEALDASKAACVSHEDAIADLRKQISDSKIETVQHDSRLQLERDLRAKAEEKENEERAERIALAAQLNAQVQEHALKEKQLRESMESMKEALEEEVRVKEGETRAKQVEMAKCQETITTLEANQASLKQSLSEQKSMLDASKEEEIGRLKGEIANLESRLRVEAEKLQSAGVVSEARVRELEEIIRKGQAERKRMHNIIQELRGNVRVFARIRPFIPDDGKQGEESETPFVSHDGDAMVTVTNPNGPSQKNSFSFDRVFAPSAGQEAVYDEVSQFIQSSLDGYNVCLFSYGQTGSGKTHTMQGTGTGVMRGLIPRSIEQIGSHKIQLEKDGWVFHVKVSFLEIYNEVIRDLLRDQSDGESKHEIKVGSDGRRTVTNLTVRPIDPNDNAAVEAVLALAAKRRSTASTDMNATSSRSHSVFTLDMIAKHEGRNQMVRGTLNLVDLAGSERLDRSNVQGQHAKEACAINKSLSSLADVFTAIGQKASHIPFRNSRLTYLLQPALSGDGKTCMVVNISPTEGSVQESICSLRFASKVNKCELGKAKRTIGEVKSGASTKRGNTAGGKGSNATAGNRNVKRKL